jgi:CBS domain-containing protein
MDAREEPVDTRVKDVLRTKGTLNEGTDVLSAEPTATVYDCIARMSERDFGSILVMDGDNIEGIFTERDNMHDLVLEGRSSEETEVQVVMTDDVVTVDPETQLEDCLDLMTEIECRHLPVVDEDGQLTDIISMRDCALQISEAAKSEVLQLRNFVTSRYPM